MVIRTFETDPEFTLEAVPRETGERPRDGWQRTGRTRSIGPAVVVLCLLVVAAGAVALYLLGTRSPALPPQAASAPSDPTPAAPERRESAVAYPVEKIAAAAPGADRTPLPALDESDAVAKDVIGAIVSHADYVTLLAPDSLVRRIVATIDNLPRAGLAPGIRALRPAPGSFVTQSTAHGITVAASNAGRYAVYVKAAEAIDTQRLVGFYARLYPLFQQAYVELGYPDGYFNDRLVAVIDHLLAAPEPRAPVYLIQPKVRYQFADPELEGISAGQKILVRVGIDNELRLKAKLREIRGALTGGAKRP